MVQRLHILFTLHLHLDGLPAAVLSVVLGTSFGGSDRHVELCDLVGVLARCWHFDGTCPVEVEVAKSEGQMLDVNL